MVMSFLCGYGSIIIKQLVFLSESCVNVVPLESVGEIFIVSFPGSQLQVLKNIHKLVKKVRSTG
jgi:hypothetical protein